MQCCSAHQCYENLITDGLKAKQACDNNQVTQAFEKIVETNILLSGLGFESGGLAGAHAMHDGLTVVHDIHKCKMHGEIVAFGTIAQLVLENAPEEEYKAVGEKTCIPDESIHNIPFDGTADMVEKVIACIKTADQIGREYKYGE